MKTEDNATLVVYPKDKTRVSVILDLYLFSFTLTKDAGKHNVIKKETNNEIKISTKTDNIIAVIYAVAFITCTVL